MSRARRRCLCIGAVLPLLILPLGACLFPSLDSLLGDGGDAALDVMNDGALDAIATDGGSGDGQHTDATTDAASPEFTVVQASGIDVFGEPLSVNVSTPSPQTSGNLNVVAISFESDGYPSSVVSVTDTDLNTYVAALPAQSSTDLEHAIWYAKNIHGGTSNNTITVQSLLQPGSDAGAADPCVRVVELAGLDTTSPILQHNSSSGTGSPATSGNIVTTTPNVVLLAAGVTEYSETFADAGASFTFIPTPTSSPRTMLEYRIVNATGTYAASAPLTDVNGEFVMQILALH